MKRFLHRSRPFYVHIATLFFLLFFALGVLQLLIAFRQSYVAAYNYQQEKAALVERYEGKESHGLDQKALRHLAWQEALKASGPALVVLLLLFPAVWLVAKRTTNPLLLLRQEMDAIRHFNFSDRHPPVSRIQEINDLIETMASMKRTIREFMTLGKALAAEHRCEPLMTAILQETIKVAGAQGGVMYLREQNGQGKSFVPVRAYWMREEFRGLPSLGSQEHVLQAAARGLRQFTSLEEDGWKRDFAPFSPWEPGCFLVSEPLFDSRHEVIGILAVILPRTDKTEIQSRIALIEALAGSAQVSLETQQLISAQKDLLSSLIELLASAIDAKSPYMGGHCQRVPVLTEMLAKAACAEREGPLSTFRLDEEEWEALRLASWLHDCGKITTPEFVMDKATKLETIYNRIHEIRMRFEVLKRDAELEASRSLLNEEQLSLIAQKVTPLWQELDEEFAFVASCNQGDRFLDLGKLQRLRSIGKRQWIRTLDDRLGLSQEELQRKQQSVSSPCPSPELLLSDRPEHVVKRTEAESSERQDDEGFKLQPTPHLYNRGELYNLSIVSGTLTEEERYKINQHITQTILMLQHLPFPRHLRGVPEIAGGHHEKLDGSGYPRHLKKYELSLPARMIAIADIFEALTARDRPYKSGKTVAQALGIMADMVRKEHLDKDLFTVMLQSGMWRLYAERFLTTPQLDAVDVPALLAQAGVFKGTGDYCFSTQPLSAIMG